MKRVLLIMALISFTFANYIQNGYYKIGYTYINYSVSPTVGKMRYTFVLKKGNPTNIIDLKNATFTTPQEAYGVSEVSSVLLGNIQGFIVNYRNSKPYKIRDKKNPYYVIYIDSIKRIKSNYKLNILKERVAELNRNYRKWLKRGFNSYIIRVQDSRLSNQYSEGVELMVKNNHIIKAKDIRDYSEIDTNNPNFLTVKGLFGVAKWAIKDAILDYDRKYGYPTFIGLTNGITINSYYLKSFYKNK